MSCQDAVRATLWSSAGVLGKPLHSELWIRPGAEFAEGERRRSARLAALQTAMLNGGAAVQTLPADLLGYCVGAWTAPCMPVVPLGAIELDPYESMRGHPELDSYESIRMATWTAARRLHPSRSTPMDTRLPSIGTISEHAGEFHASTLLCAVVQGVPAPWSPRRGEGFAASGDGRLQKVVPCLRRYVPGARTTSSCNDLAQGLRACQTLRRPQLSSVPRPRHFIASGYLQPNLRYRWNVLKRSTSPQIILRR